MFSIIKTSILNHRLLWFILISLLLLKSKMYNSLPIYWDTASYLAMAKHLYTGGQIGFLEPFRPVILPIFLGALWKLNLDPIFWGSFVHLLTTLGSIILTYAIGIKIYDKRTGMLAALFLSLSYAWFAWGNSILTDIPSTFLGLLAVYLFINNKYSSAGWIGTLACLTKFTQGIILTLIYLTVALRILRTKLTNQIRCLIQLSIGCITLVVAYLIFNELVYGDPLMPFRDAKEIYAQDMGSWLDGIVICLKKIIQIEGVILVFVPLGIYFTFKNSSENKALIIMLGLTQFLWVARMPTEITRFFIGCLPYLYLLCAYGLVMLIDCFHKIKKLIVIMLFVLITLHTLVQTERLATNAYKAFPPSVFQKYLHNHQDTLEGPIWISNPLMFVYTDLKANELMYYPVFNKKKIAYLRANLPESGLILFDRRGLKCYPNHSRECYLARNALIDDIRARFNEEYFYVHPETGNFWGIYKKE